MIVVKFSQDETKYLFDRLKDADVKIIVDEKEIDFEDYRKNPEFLIRKAFCLRQSDGTFTHEITYSILLDSLQKVNDPEQEVRITNNLKSV